MPEDTDVMTRPTRRGPVGQLGKQIPELLIIVFVVGVFLAVAIPAFQDSRAAGHETWQAVIFSFVFGAVGLVVAVVALLALGGLVGLLVESGIPKVGKEVKVPRGKFKGQRAVVEAIGRDNQAIPNSDGIVRMRLISTGEVLRVPEWLFGNPNLFDEDCRWMKEDVRVKVLGIYDCTGRIEKHDEDTHAVLVLLEGRSESIWLSPNFLKPL